MTYTFDIAYDCPIQEFLVMLDSFDLQLDSWVTIGPGGGNPEVTISGTEENITQFDSFYFNKI